MDNGYFYEEQSEQYTFYRIPKILVVNSKYEKLPSEAKLLYGLFLDRMSLSVKNHWADDQGRIFIYYTLESIERDMHCAVQKAVKLMKDLESFGLIERIRQGQGRPTRIYMKDFVPLRKAKAKTNENHKSSNMKSKGQDLSKSFGSNTEINYPEYSKTDLIISEDRSDEDMREQYRAYFTETLSIQNLKEQNPFDQRTIDGIMELILDTVCSKKDKIRISGEYMSLNVVKGRFMKLDSGHIEYVLDCIQKNSTKIHNIRQYMLAALYNAPVTIESYYRAEVNHDMASGII